MKLVLNSLAQRAKTVLWIKLALQISLPFVKELSHSAQNAKRSANMFIYQLDISFTIHLEELFKSNAQLFSVGLQRSQRNRPPFGSSVTSESLRYDVPRTA